MEQLKDQREREKGGSIEEVFNATTTKQQSALGVG